MPPNIFPLKNIYFWAPRFFVLESNSCYINHGCATRVHEWNVVVSLGVVQYLVYVCN